MYIYCGHGAGEQYLPAQALRRLPACAAALLMGCSSGRLALSGDYDACGPVLAYLLAGANPEDMDCLAMPVCHARWGTVVPEIQL